MNVHVGEQFEAFVAELVKQGRYRSASEVVREGLRLVQEREAKLQALHQTLNRSIERGGSHTSEDVDAHISAHLDAVERDMKGA